MNVKNMKLPESVSVVDCASSLASRAKEAASVAKSAREFKSKFSRFFRADVAAPLVNAAPKRAAALARAAELSQEFRVVKLDKEIKRKVAIGKGKATLNLPLVLSVELPAPAKVSFRRALGYSEYRIHARVPTPPDAALEAIKKHGAKFDKLEVWWVPRDLKVVEIKKRPKADPIVVGRIDVPRVDGKAERLYFELHRWFQAEVEDAYFTREAY